MRKRFGRDAKIGAVLVIAAVAAIVILVGMLPSYGDNSRTPVSGLHLNESNPPPDIPPYMVEFSITAITSSVRWSDLSINLVEGSNHTSWYPSSEGLSGSTPTIYCCGTGSLGSMAVTCNITDLSGDGIASGGDLINLTATIDATFMTTQNYTISILYIPTGMIICSLTFNGVPMVVDTQ